MLVFVSMYQVATHLEDSYFRPAPISKKIAGRDAPWLVAGRWPSLACQRRRVVDGLSGAAQALQLPLHLTSPGPSVKSGRAPSPLVGGGQFFLVSRPTWTLEMGDCNPRMSLF